MATHPDERSGVPGCRGRPVNRTGCPAGRNVAVASCSLRSHAPTCRSASSERNQSGHGVASPKVWPGRNVRRSRPCSSKPRARGAPSKPTSSRCPQHRVHGRRPRLGGAADFVADAYGSETAPAGQPSFGHPSVLPRSDLHGDRIVDSIAASIEIGGRSGRHRRLQEASPMHAMTNNVTRSGHGSTATPVSG